MQVNQLILQFNSLLSLDQYVAYYQTSIQHDTQSIQKKNINRISNIKQNMYEKEKEKNLFNRLVFPFFDITLKSGAIK